MDSNSSEETGNQRIEKPELALLIGILLFVSWYFWDAANASSSVINLVLIAPVSVVVVLLVVVEFFRQLFKAHGTPANREQGDSLAAILPIVFLFGSYVALLPWLGFDFGTFLFLLVFLNLRAGASWKVSLLFSAGFAVVAALFFSTMLPYPMPMLVLPTDY